MKLQNAFLLDQYCQEFFLPALRGCSQADIPARIDRQLKRLTLFEALAWLEIGARLEAFPRTVALDLIREYSLPLRQQYDLYLEDPARLAPRELVELSGRLIRDQDILEGPDFDGGSLFTFFRSCMTLAACVATDDSVSAIASAVRLINPHVWKLLLSRFISGDEIMSAILDEDHVWVDGHCALVYSGVLKLVPHVEGLLGILDFQNCPEGTDSRHWTWLRKAVCGAHNWRWDFEEPEVKERFDQLVPYLARLMDTNLALVGIAIERDGLLKYIHDLMKRWLGLKNPMVLSARS